MKRSYLATAVLLASAALTTSAFAHAHLTSAIPAANSTVKAPTEVTLHFTEALEPRFSTIQVLNAAGQDVGDGKPYLAASSATTFITGVKALTPGAYKVVWHATSVDTHKTEGTFQFTVER
jgi:copper resistance protein C